MEGGEGSARGSEGMSGLVLGWERGREGCVEGMGEARMNML